MTSDNYPKGDAATVRLMCMRKEACHWLKEWTCPCTLITALETWLTTDNEHYLHSALGDKPPGQCERAYYHSPSPPFPAA